jgi:hypothetical protein
MKVHYRRTIREKLDEVIAEAKKEGRGIDWIELDEGEWGEFGSGLGIHSVCNRSEGGRVTHSGIEVRRKVEPADEVKDDLVLNFFIDSVSSEFYEAGVPFPFTDHKIKAVAQSYSGCNVGYGLQFTVRSKERELKIEPGDVLEVRVK